MQYSANFHTGGLLVEKSEIEIGDVIGKGSFGVVKQGKMERKSCSTEKDPVARRIQ